MEAKFCALSPAVTKTWNKLIFRNKKSPLVQRQIENLSRHNSNESIVSIPSSVWSSERDESDYEQNTKQKRYASIRKLNEVKQSTKFLNFQLYEVKIYITILDKKNIKDSKKANVGHFLSRVDSSRLNFFPS